MYAKDREEDGGLSQQEEAPPRKSASRTKGKTSNIVRIKKFETQVEADKELVKLLDHERKKNKINEI